MSKNNKTMSRMRKFLKDYFFEGVDDYKTKDCGEWVLEHRWNGNSNQWEVAIFTRDSFERMEKGKQKYFSGDFQKSEEQLKYQHLMDI